MLASHSRPEGITWTLDGAGAAFLTDEGALTNGRPGDGTRIQWLSGAQTTASVMRLRGQWPAARVPNLNGLVGLTLPAGTRIVAGLRRAIDSDFDYVTVEQRIFQRQDGVRVAWFSVPDDLDPCVGVEFAIYNDVGGVASIAADSTFTVGEAWTGSGGAWCIRPEIQDGRGDLSVLRKSIGGQPFPVRRRAEGKLQMDFAPVIYGRAYGTGSLDELREAMLGYQPVVIVPMRTEPFTGGGSVDADFVNRHALFGYAEPGPIVGEAPRFVMSAAVTAPPALRP